MSAIVVKSEEYLYRRYYTPQKKYMNPDGTATSRVFKLREKDMGELSVDVKSLTTPIKSVVDPEKFFLFELPNRAVEELGLVTYHAPLPDATNNAHAVIVGMKIEDEILPKQLASKSRVVLLL